MGKRENAEVISAENNVSDGNGSASAELSALAAEASAIDMETAPAEVQAQVAAEQEAAAIEAARDPVAETAAMIDVAIKMLSPVLPYLKGIYTPETIQGLAAAYVPVADKYGWAVGGGIFEKYGPEIMLAATALPLASATMTAHKAFVAERKAKAAVEKIAQREFDAVAPVEQGEDHGGKLQRL